MIPRVLSARPDDLDESVFQRLVDDRVAEHQRLDFKRELPGDTKDSRREHARDVAAMANGGGGLLIFGVAEEDDAAAEITPVPLGDEVTRLRQVTNSLLEPYLHLEIEEVEVGDDPGQGVIVVSVPSSARRPFAVVEGSRLGYFRRTGRNRHPMDEAEVARMYTERVDRLQSVSQRLHELTTGVANRIADLAIGALPEEETLASRPIAYLAVAPVEAYSRLFRPDPQTLGVISNIAVGRVFGIPEYGEILPRDYRPGFKRVDIAHGFTPRLLVYGWSELHDDGSFVGVIVGRPPGFEPAHQLNDGTQLAGFYDVQLAVQVIARLTGFGALAKEFDIHGELAVEAGFLAMGLPAILIAAGGRTEPLGAQTLDRAVETTLSLDSSDLLTQQGVLRAAALILDDFATAFAWSKNAQLERDGTIRLRGWSHEVRAMVEQSAQQRGLDIHRDP